MKKMLFYAAALVVAAASAVGAQQQTDRQLLEQIRSMIDAHIAASPLPEPEPIPPVDPPDVSLACGGSIVSAYNEALPGASVLLQPGCDYPRASLSPRPDTDATHRITITTAGYASKGEGHQGRVTPADRPRMARIVSTTNEAALEIKNGPNAGNISVVGVAFTSNGSTTSTANSTVIRLGNGSETSLANVARHITFSEWLFEGNPAIGARRVIEANASDVLIEKGWCQEAFVSGQDNQCVAGWTGANDVTIRLNYLAAGAENIIIGGAPILAAELHPHNWVIEDNILHKPMRWQTDGVNRQVKNLFEIKFVTGVQVRRNLMVNNWVAAQNGIAVLISYATNGTCGPCGGIHDVVFEDNVVLNTVGGLSLGGYAYSDNTFTTEKLSNVVARNNYFETTGTGSNRTILVSNVFDRHDFRLDHNTFVNNASTDIVGSYGYVWKNTTAREPGGPMKGFWLTDNVFAQFGTYGITAPDAMHYGTGLSTFVNEDLQVSGNIFGGITASQLNTLNALKGAGDANQTALETDLRAALPVTSCGQYGIKGADCSRLHLVFALRSYLPEP
jgi:hypothetical protein